MNESEKKLREAIKWEWLFSNKIEAEHEKQYSLKLERLHKAAAKEEELLVKEYDKLEDEEDARYENAVKGAKEKYIKETGCDPEEVDGIEEAVWIEVGIAKKIPDNLI
jgi:hypothetical protein